MSTGWWVIVLTFGPVGFFATLLLAWGLCRSAAIGDEPQERMLARRGGCDELAVRRERRSAGCG